ncbi:EAL domain-containing protein [Rhizobium sp. KVB221]|uniref:EAL domain-containing protein n=1 Tax=Rhizobium setariae TaxID=2801340 RepID=A0A937CJ82_9HYPH|nr:bifunctional diguanylate cyclase/phosphodiesterase [Rhizobium setariae]MBL0370835.1 EAL domain-containing protein [Rhizobium setariae]
MISVINCITDAHNLWLVLVAAFICVSGSWSVIRLFRRGKAASGGEAFGWQFLAAVAAGASIWSTHFVAMLAYHPGTPVAFDPVLTVISLLVAMVGSLAGLIVAGIIRTRWSPAIGGGMVGLAIAIMHYTGMRAYVIEGSIDWNSTYLIASIMLAISITSIAFHVANLYGSVRGKAASVGFLTLAIVSLHFTGMTALQITPLSISPGFTNPGEMQAMALAIALVCFIIVGSVLASYLIDNQTRSRSMSQLRHMALSDALTGLANRASFNDHLDESIEVASKQGQKFALAAIDLDRFKEINDLRGHSAGDTTLQILAQRMRDFDNGSLFVARVGGDEFSVILPLSDPLDMRNLLVRLRNELIRPFTIGEEELSVGASIGVCVFPDDATEKSALINYTDLALYRAKTEIADKICFFDNVMDENVRNKRELAADLRYAIEHNQLEVHYQVQATISDSVITGYEALLRWNHPLRGAIPPSEFIPLAEENGIILQLGEWVLRMACKQCAPLGIKVAVNLSPIQFLHPNLPGLVEDILAETGMRAENLELELTESAIIHDKERTLVQLQAIRKLGVTIALDDFGTGYSSLDTLRAFPFDKIKLDRTFMNELETSDQARSIIRAVLSLGRSLEIPVLAEGIETSDQLAILAEEGCQSAQGYFLGRPAPLSMIVSAIEVENLEAPEKLAGMLNKLRDADDSAETAAA